MPEPNRQILLKSRPREMPTESNFELVTADRPTPAQGQVLVRNIWMSVDPYMRGRMREGSSYVEPFEIGRPLAGGCVGQVVESRSDRFQPGDYVLAQAGWREWFTASADDVQPIDPDLAPAETYLGIMGMPGMTAWVGLLHIAQLHEGESVFVSAAAGAVGSIACQIARLKHCRVVGSAGDENKIRWLTEVAGIDHAFNYNQTNDIARELRNACPDGLDVYYDNVGGDHLEAALACMKHNGRIVACGMIQGYNEEIPPAGPRNLFEIIVRRLRVQGFIVFDHQDLEPQFRRDMSQWIRDNKIKWEETVYEGLEKAPEAFIGLFTGANLGKMLVKIGPDPAV